MSNNSNNFRKNGIIEDELKKKNSVETITIGYKRSLFKFILTWILIILTLGILRLFFHWWKQYYIYFTMERIPSEDLYDEADVFVIEENFQGLKYKRYHVKYVYTLQNNFNQEKSGPISKGEGKYLYSPASSSPTIKLYNYKKHKYIYNKNEHTKFLKLNGLDHDISTYSLHNPGGSSKYDIQNNTNEENISQSYYKGLNHEEFLKRKLIYGPNEINIRVQSIIKLLFLEVLNPFYIFQIFSVSLWVSDEYYYYSVAIVIMSVLGIVSTTHQTRQNQKKLKLTVESTSNDIIQVFRNYHINSNSNDYENYDDDNEEAAAAEKIRYEGKVESIQSSDIVIGDLIIIPSNIKNYIMQCDAVLLNGNVIVNESMLTGESVPVTKTPLPMDKNIKYSSKDHNKNTLYSGTQILQTRYYGNEYVLARVIRTGFLTTKGNLIRSIMYPHPVDYKFDRDSYKFIGFLSLIAFVGFLYSVFLKISKDETVRNIIIDSLDLITIVVPPALPAAMTVGRYYSQRRLEREKGIYCISPRAINIAGSINCVCFDKTGTLTEEGLDLLGISVFNKDKNATLIKKSGELVEARKSFSDAVNGLIYRGMASCHSLTLIDGNLVGDPLDLKIFSWVSWTLEEPTNLPDNEKYDMIVPTIVKSPKYDHDNDNEEEEIGILRVFQFNSNMQRMSVICRSLKERNFEVWCKGSPEIIKDLSIPSSVPSNFTEILEKYTNHGYRVIAIGHKVIDIPKFNYTKVQRVPREEIEKDLNFLGLIIMENRLKPDTSNVISILNNANIRNIMVTGDNMLTAISVAKECGMIREREKVILIDVDKKTDDNNNLKPKLNYKLTFSSSPANSHNISKTNTPSLVRSLNSSSSPSTSSMSMSTSSDIMNMAMDDQPIIINNDNSCSYGIQIGQIGNIVKSYSNEYKLALTGNVFSAIIDNHKEILEKILVRGIVFARMNPEQKQMLIELLMSLGYYVGMCGDGANDCGALKSSHCGVSLNSEASESSVASPFTSQKSSIDCIPNLIREGRSALVTSFGIFKYMAIYSLTQFISVVLLYTISSNLSDFEFLYIDLFLISLFAIFFGHTRPYSESKKLFRKAPSASLISIGPIISIILHLVCVLCIQVLAFLYVQQQSWYSNQNYFTNATHPSDSDKDENFHYYENYAVFSVSTFQYIIMVVIFSQGKPYRKSIIHNRFLMASLIIMTTFNIYLVIYPCTFLINRFQLRLPNSNEGSPQNNDIIFSLILIGFSLCNLVISGLIEFGIVKFIVRNFSYYFTVFTTKKTFKKKRYIFIDNQLSSDFNWPPITSYVLNSNSNNQSNKRNGHNLSLVNNCNAKNHMKPSPSINNNSNINNDYNDTIIVNIPLENIENNRFLS